MTSTQVSGVPARGIIHCHSKHSYDSTLELAELCTTLSRAGYQFVAMAEHTRGFVEGQYQDYVRECEQHTTESFVVVPGLEIRCDEGTEIAGIGLSEFVADGPASEVVAHIRQRGGYAVWVHPRKRRDAGEHPPDCDAIEVLNAKVDGTVAPNLALLRRLDQWRRGNERPHALFGADLHELSEPPRVWLECSIPALTREDIVTALREGRYLNCGVHLALPSNGRISLVTHCNWAMIRAAYLLWNGFGDGIPGWLRAGLLRIRRRWIGDVEQRI